MSRFVLLGLCVVFCLLIATSPGKTQEKTSPKQPKAQRKDAEGFALPPGAVARSGSLRGVQNEAIAFLALSTDGKKAATAPEEPYSMLLIWEVPSGKLLQEIPLKMKFRDTIALSPDFSKLAWTYLDNSVTVVELATGKETVLNAPTEDGARGAAVSFSSDGKKVIVEFSQHLSTFAPTKKNKKEQAMTYVDFEIVEWTLEDSKKRQLWKDDGEKNGYVYRNVAVAPDGKTLAYIKKASTERVTDFGQEFVLENAVTRKAKLKFPLKDGSDCLMEFSPDGKVLAVADEDALRIMDVAQGKVSWTVSYKDKLRRPEPGYFTRQPWPRKMIWLHGGEVGIQFEAGTLWTWKTADGKPSMQYTSQATKVLAVAKDAPVLAFTQDRRSLQFLDTSNGKALQPVEGHRNPPNVLFRSDGSLLSHDEKKICLWTSGDWRLSKSFEFHDEGQRFCFGPSQDYFVRAIGEKVEARSLENGKVVKELTLKSAPDFVFLMPDNKTVVAGNLYKSSAPEHMGAERYFVRLLDIATGDQKEIRLPYQPWHVTVSPAADALALCYWENHRNYVDVLDTASRKLRRLIDDPTVDVSLLKFSPDGRKLYFKCAPVNQRRPYTLASVELSTGKTAKHLLEGHFSLASISLDGRSFFYSPSKYVQRIYGKKDGVGYWGPSTEIVIWEMAANSERARLETGSALVNSISCSPNSRYLATGLNDSTILIWDLQLTP